MVVPNNPELRAQIIKEAHDSLYAGHKGQTATIAFLRKYFTWPNLDTTVKNYIKHCETCQKHKRDYNSQHGLLQPLPTPSKPWEVVGIDFVTGLPHIKHGHDAIMVVVDHLTKMAHAIPCRKSITAQETAQLFVKEIFRLHGLPTVIVSDRGSQFTSQFWNTLFTKLGTKLSLTSAYHPQSNGLTERVNGNIMETLRIFSSQQPAQWDQVLALAEFAYNNATSSVTHQTPFCLNYGKEVAVPIILLNATSIKPLLKENPLATRALNNLKKQWDKAHDAVTMAKQKMAQKYNRTAKRNPYRVGDPVLLSTANLKLKGYDFPKFYPLFVGPFTVQEVGNNTVRLVVPGALSEFFSIKRVKPYHHHDRQQQQTEVLPPPKLLAQQQSVQWKLENILRQRFAGPKRSIKQYLVSFEGCGPENNSWISAQDLKDLFGDKFKRLLHLFNQRQKN